MKLMCFNQEIVQNDLSSDSKILIFNKDSYDQVSPPVWLAAELVCISLATLKMDTHARQVNIARHLWGKLSRSC